jgi:hypothetical protein
MVQGSGKAWPNDNLWMGTGQKNVFYWSMMAPADTRQKVQQKSTVDEHETDDGVGRSRGQWASLEPKVCNDRHEDGLLVFELPFSTKGRTK